MRTSIISLFVIVAFVLAGCNQNSGAAGNSDAAAHKTAATPVDAATAGTIRGVVRFSGAVPKPASIDMGLDPACNMSAEPNSSEQLMVSGGKLANVYVYVKAGLTEHSYPAPTSAMTITQKGCRYIPHVGAARTGQTIRVVNEDPAMHNIHPTPREPGNHEWNVSQPPKGDPIEKSFNTPEVMMPVKCNQHPWMKMYLNLADNPYFAVTGADGAFEIANLPPGDYTLAAVQEKLGEKDIAVHVGPKQTQQVTFDFQ